MAKQSEPDPDKYGDTSLEFLRIDDDPEEMKDDPQPAAEKSEK